MWTVAPSTERSPPPITSFRYLVPSIPIRLAIARFAWASSAVILSSVALAFSGFDSFTSTSTFGVPGERVESELILLIRSSGRISAARTSPDSTLSMASAREWTWTHSTFSQIRDWTLAEGSFEPLRLMRAFCGTSLRKATRGFSGPREIAKPTRTAISTG